MVESNEQKRATKNRRKQNSGNDAVTGKGLAAPKGKSGSTRNHENSTCKPVRTRRIRSGEFGRKAGGIIRQRRLAIQTQLAFHKEQIRQLEREDRQMKVLLDEFNKEEVQSSSIEGVD